MYCSERYYEGLSSLKISSKWYLWIMRYRRFGFHDFIVDLSLNCIIKNAYFGNVVMIGTVVGKKVQMEQGKKVRRKICKTVQGNN